MKLPANAGARRRRGSRAAVSQAASGKVCAWERGGAWGLSLAEPKDTLVRRRVRGTSGSTRCCCPARSSRRPKAGAGRPPGDSSWWTSAAKPCSRYGGGPLGKAVSVGRTEGRKAWSPAPPPGVRALPCSQKWACALHVSRGRAEGGVLTTVSMTTVQPRFPTGAQHARDRSLESPGDFWALLLSPEPLPSLSPPHI